MVWTTFNVDEVQNQLHVVLIMFPLRLHLSSIISALTRTTPFRHVAYRMFVVESRRPTRPVSEALA